MTQDEEIILRRCIRYAFVHPDGKKDKAFTEGITKIKQLVFSALYEGSEAHRVVQEEHEQMRVDEQLRKQR